MDPLFITVGLIAIVLTAIYYYGTSNYDYWEKRGVPYRKPKFPFLGTAYESALSFKHSYEVHWENYKVFKGKPFGGIFLFTQPALCVRDLELIEKVLIKDFSYFVNRGIKTDLKLNPMGASLVNLRDAEWKSLRNKLTPVFTSGKLKGMFQQLLDCSEELVMYLEKHSKNGTPFESKPVMSSYAINVISSCAFGLNANGLKDFNSVLVRIARSVFEPTFKSKLSQAMRGQYPWVMKLLNFRRVSHSNENYFKKTIDDTLKHREKNNIVRLDFLHMLNELKIRDLKYVAEHPDEKMPLVFDDQVMVSNAFSFFAAGYETTATLLGFLLYELSLNQDVQERLYQELLGAVEANEGELTYESLKNAVYLKQVISETLRKHPPAVGVLREVSKPYTLPGTSVVLPVGMMVQVPIYSLHHDPDYFPDPDKFDPERFSEENKHNLKKGTFMPFGDGPRICIGERFSKLEAEVAIAKVLLNFRLTLNSKTQEPLKFIPSALVLSPVGGIWVNVEKRLKA